MDRRKFFKMFGGVTAVPFVPFKWEAGKPKKAKGMLNPQSPSGKSYIEPNRLFIDGVEYTNKCYALELKQNIINITPMGVEYRVFAKAQPQQTQVSIDLYGVHDLSFDQWHQIIIHMADGTITTMNAMITSNHLEYTTHDLARTHFELCSDGPVTSYTRGV